MNSIVDHIRHRKYMSGIERDRVRVKQTAEVNISQRVFGAEQSKMRLNFAVQKRKLAGKYVVGGVDLNTEEAFRVKKFDVVVGNPPYNAGDTSREDSNHRGQGKNLAKQFILKSLELGEHVFLIAPYGHRTYSDAVKKHYKNKGLYKIYPCSQHFKGVSTNAAVFLFGKNPNLADVDDAFATSYKVPNNNLGKLFHNQPGRLNRQDYEHKLADAGCYKIIVTTSIVKYTNDENIINGLADKTRPFWRVVFNCTTSKEKIGKVLIAEPGTSLSKSVHCLTVESEAEAQILKNYLLQQDTIEKLASIKTNSCNSQKFLKYLKNPLK